MELSDSRLCESNRRMFDGAKRPFSPATKEPLRWVGCSPPLWEPTAQGAVEGWLVAVGAGLEEAFGAVGAATEEMELPPLA